MLDALNRIADMIAKTLILLAACIIILYAGFNLYVDHQLRSTLRSMNGC